MPEASKVYSHTPGVYGSTPSGSHISMHAHCYKPVNPLGSIPIKPDSSPFAESLMGGSEAGKDSAQSIAVPFSYRRVSSPAIFCIAVIMYRRVRTPSDKFV